MPCDKSRTNALSGYDRAVRSKKPKKNLPRKQGIYLEGTPSKPVVGVLASR